MTSYRYLGYGVTNENGIAKLDHKPNGDPLTNSYTDIGAGKVDLVASLDDEITEDSLVSQPTTLTDCIMYETGTGSSVNAMIRWSGSSSVTPTNDGLSMVNNGSSGTTYVGIDKEGTSSSVTDWIEWEDFVFEFEAVSNDGCVFQLRPATSTMVQYYLNNLTAGDIFRAEYTNGTVKLFKNNVQQGGDYSFTDGELTAIRFGIPNGKSATIKNITLYPI